MPHDIDHTHDPNLESWIESANDPGTDFPPQNLPLATVVRYDEDGGAWPNAATRVGDMVIDLTALAVSGLVDDEDMDWSFEGVDEIAMMGSWKRLREQVQRLVLKGADALRDFDMRDQIVIPAEEAELTLPFGEIVSDYTDFYASVFHATSVGSMFRPDNPLLPNYKHIPIAYHGRSSSVVPSGTPIRRPMGQTIEGDVAPGATPTFGPCRLLDYELEVGIVLAKGSELGSRIPIDEAEEHILGLCLLNDWSARDMQKWEYQPLGPFLAKSFATTIGAYIVTLDALAPFRCPAYARPDGDPAPLAYLTSDTNTSAGGVDLQLEVLLASATMREQGIAPVRISKGGFREMYWTIAQMLTHHASNGCPMTPGDLLGSGTVSGPTRESRGCLLELTWDGDPFANPPVKATGAQRTPIRLPTGEERKFLADWDEVIIRGYCERDGFRRIGFGECRGVVTPAQA